MSCTFLRMRLFFSRGPNFRSAHFAKFIYIRDVGAFVLDGTCCCIYPAFVITRSSQGRQASISQASVMLRSFFLQNYLVVPCSWKTSRIQIKFRLQPCLINPVLKRSLLLKGTSVVCFCDSNLPVVLFAFFPDAIFRFLPRRFPVLTLALRAQEA